MNKIYLRLILRNLAKNKVYSLINIFGLSIGLTCAILIILYTEDEFSFDKFHNEIESLYLIVIDVRNPDGSSDTKMSETGILHGPRFKANVPEIDSYIRLNRIKKNIMLGDDLIIEEVIETDTNFFSLLSFPLIHGNPQKALSQKNNIVISESMALKYFGTENAIDKNLLLENKGELVPYTVSGVAQRCPENSSIQFDFIIPYLIPVEEESNPSNWVNVNLTTIVKLNNGCDYENVAEKIQKVFEVESKTAMEQVRAYGFEQSFYHYLKPFEEIHLGKDYIAEAALTKSSKLAYSYLLNGIAAFILIIALINFINLTLAKSIKRAKEIGIRKVIGSSQIQLISQFIYESFFLCIVSFILAMIIANLFLPLFNEMVDKNLSFSYLLDYTLVLKFLFLLLFTGILSGLYPAILLSKYNPIQILYNRFKISGKNKLQRILIIFQFILTTILVISTFAANQQFNFLTKSDLGFDSNNVIVVPKRNLSNQESEKFRQELLSNPSILSVSPNRRSKMNAKVNGGKIQNFVYETVDQDFFNLLGIKTVLGRTFSSSYPSDSAFSVVVNESFVKEVGWINPIGQEVDMFLYNGNKMKVIGVVKDYNFESLKSKILPQLFTLTPDPEFNSYDNFLIRIHPNSDANSISIIEKTFKKIFPMTPFNYQYYIDKNLKSYDIEEKWREIVFTGSIITIFIGCIGLIGLSMFTTENRFKEIGIRKVLGASNTSIVVILFNELFKLVLIALVISLPIAFFGIKYWLELYPYKIDLEIQMFVLSGFLVLLIATFTIGYQTIKAARMNPIQSIKME